MLNTKEFLSLIKVNFANRVPISPIYLRLKT